MAKSNRAKIIYRDTVDGKIEVLRFENVMSEDDLHERFGPEVTRLYLQSGDSFQGDGGQYIYCRSGSSVLPGVMTKELFHNRIEYLIQCGERLSELIKRVKDEDFTKERTILI